MRLGVQNHKPSARTTIEVQTSADSPYGSLKGFQDNTNLVISKWVAAARLTILLSVSYLDSLAIIPEMNEKTSLDAERLIKRSWLVLYSDMF